MEKTYVKDGKIVFATAPKVKHTCLQCRKDMGFEYLLGAVCGTCCRRNHKRVIGR